VSGVGCQEKIGVRKDYAAISNYVDGIGGKTGANNSRAKAALTAI